jgi:eukaryotic-like serine/threonine-protein kinase
LGSSSEMTTVTKAGRYEIIGELGRGAMGVVYRAVDPVIGRNVAVKAIRLTSEGTGLSRQELLQRFQTEARAAGLLTHTNIVVVYDAGEEDGLYYITMELVDGKSLQALLDDGHAFPLPRVLRIMEQACSALQFAHERNVVHRDIKPANIMLTADDTVKITDFGTAKILQFGTVQQTAHVMGTPSYMSPEQVKGKAVDGRSDIFSLGVMLYEMVTREKPFPGQNITTVIYKIVNEHPVPPKQVDPAIHPGISAVVMKALEKDPEHRYQSCREMLEDLHNYRALANASASPLSTIALGGGLDAPNATLALPPGLRGVHSDDSLVASAARSLDARTASPTQTPGLRRTGVLAPVLEPKRKKSLVGTIFAALFLLGVIGYCGYKLVPIYYAVRQQHRPAPANASATQTDGSQNTETPAPDGVSSEAAGTQSNDASENADSADTGNAAPLETKAPEPHVTKAAARNSLTSRAAEYKGRIEEALDEKGLSGRVRVQGVNNTLVLAGKLRPAEHGALLKFLRDAPSDVHLVDHIEYDDAAQGSPASSGSGGHPVPGPGYGAIHVVTDVIGATAYLHGSTGRVINQCLTPCSFNNLVPQQYSLEVKKDGYQPVQTALQVRTGAVADQKLSLEALIKGIVITSRPPGADVFINGAKQSGQTPVTLPLAPGQYNLVLRLQGYDPYVGSIQVKENVPTQLDATLNERSLSRVAFADVHSNPAGAEIFIDGTSTGKFTPSRIELPTGMHTITMRLSGYEPAKRTVQASEGGTVPVEVVLRQK